MVVLRVSAVFPLRLGGQWSPPRSVGRVQDGSVVPGFCQNGRCQGSFRMALEVHEGRSELVVAGAQAGMIASESKAK